MLSAYQWMDVDNSTSITLVTFKTRAILDERVIRMVGDELLRLEKTGCRKFLMDFRGVDHLSSSILANLITLHKRLIQRGGKLVLCGLNPEVAQIFEVTHLNRVLAIQADAMAAREALD
jgi:anti-sigma B factor antagonist